MPFLFLECGGFGTETAPSHPVQLTAVMFSPDLIRRIRGLEIRASHLVDEMLAGQYRSAFKGSGIEFEGVVPYQVGDDVRTIDWKVTARNHRPYVKRYREERELTVQLLVDLSGSLDFGSAERTKRDVLEEAAALLSFTAMHNGDKVGLVLFTDAVEHVVQPKKGPRQAVRLIRDLVTWGAHGTRTNLTAALEHLQHSAKRRAVAFVLSDFLASGYENALRLTRRRHDVVPIIIRDRREVELPRCGLLQVADAETGEPTLFDTFSRRQRREFRAQIERDAARRKQLFRQLEIEPLELWTHESVVEPLRRFLLRRGNRR